MIDERNVGTAFFDYKLRTLKVYDTYYGNLSLLLIDESTKLYKMHINSTDKKGGKHNESFK